MGERRRARSVMDFMIQGLTLFGPLRQPGRSRKGWSLLASLAVHGTVLAVLMIPPEPVFIKPSLVARGRNGSSVLVYLPSRAAQETLVTPRPQKSLLSLPARESSHPKAKPQPVPPENIQAESRKGDSSPAGSLYGSDSSGSFSGDDVRPALPVTFTEPRISKADLPPGVQGEVVAIITIDAQGNVVEARLVKSIGYGIDQKVLSALHEWHFQPATRNGVAIPSRHEVHYPFPG
jgi:TonB family protein